MPLFDLPRQVLTSAGIFKRVGKGSSLLAARKRLRLGTSPRARQIPKRLHCSKVARSEAAKLGLALCAGPVERVRPDRPA